ncbi:ABC transporter ATP-binding protein [uncultured Ferrovibrio sp.]|jgi:peptide/nickel transport system ATP-binding protein|uniref:ABC transporter ATP-binding protein n=1 Tax=uncultured Ferrovibrio sp. TaxID=1576913 RepID=UPI002618B3E2|nr:ABC transporter ATP-binding protein [uncultured Ferrovibrio sp.]
MALLEVQNLQTHFRTPRGINRAVNGVSFQVKAGETLAIVGESGCGKSVTSMSIMRLLPPGMAKSAGRIIFDGRDLLTLSEKEMERVRGNDIGMIFQEPMTSLNPVLTVGFQIQETIALHQRVPRSELKRRALEMLDLVGIPDPSRRLQEYAHQLSGGMRQRIMIALALACKPKLLIADEPTTALDVTIQAQILDLLRQIQREQGTAIIFITHDLGVVAESTDRVAVMYAGRIIEEAATSTLLANPRHPYTQGLLAAVPRIGASQRARLAEIPGLVPDLRKKLEGCAFANRCAYASDMCRKLEPALTQKAPGHWAACHLVELEGGPA